MINLNHLYNSVEEELRRNVAGKFSVYYSVTPQGEITREIPVEILDVIKVLDNEVPENIPDKNKKVIPVIVGCRFKFRARNLIDNSIIERDTRCFTGELFSNGDEAQLLVEFNNKQQVLRYGDDI